MRRHAVVAALGLWVASACSPPFAPPELPPFDPLPPPDTAEVEAVVFLLGDAGATRTGGSPLLVRLASEVDAWSAALARDSAVSVVFLGDNVYPDGLRSRSHERFAADSARLWNQIRLLSGPAALEHHTTGWFLAGNHDWGGMTGAEGVARLRNQELELERARRTGPSIALIPSAGSPGPVVRDLGEDFRLVFLDTHWFLQRPTRTERRAFFSRLEEAFGTDGREVIVLAHHPWQTAGPHGVTEGRQPVGYYWLLEKTGTLVQDLNSPVYADFVRDLRERYARVGRRPLVFAAGHDHSLQVFEGPEPSDPAHTLISGAGSKLSPVAGVPGLRYAAARPGYMTLLFHDSGRLDLHVTAGSAEHLICPGAGSARERCMREGVGAFETVYSAVLREAPPDR